MSLQKEVFKYLVLSSLVFFSSTSFAKTDCTAEITAMMQIIEKAAWSGNFNMVMQALQKMSPECQTYLNNNYKLQQPGRGKDWGSVMDHGNGTYSTSGGYCDSSGCAVY